MSGVNGTALRSLTQREEKAVELHRRQIPMRAICVETGLDEEQIGVALERDAQWQTLRGQVAPKPPEVQVRSTKPDGYKTVGALLAWAEQSGTTRALTLAARVREGIAELRALAENHEARIAAQADVDRLSAELEAAKAKLRDFSGRSRSAPAGAAPASDHEDALTAEGRAAIRTWARENGHVVHERGSIRTEVVQAWRAAIQTDTATGDPA